MQKTLSAEQIEAFYHSQFVEDQVAHFTSLVCARIPNTRRVVDVGGGVGHFAQRLNQVTGCSVRVLDMDERSIQACRERGVDAALCDALNPIIVGDEDVVTFNLILHHLVGESEALTKGLQARALSVWKPNPKLIFVNEYIYESFVGNASGWLIYQITKNSLLSALAKWCSRVIPSLKANTLGVGVRFRASKEWTKLFDSAGYRVVDSVAGEHEPVATLWRILLIKSISRNSFVLVARD